MEKPQEESTPSSPAAEEKKTGKTKNILVVEDEAALANVLALKLRSEQYEVSVASNGEEALQMIKDHQFDLILLDLLLPIMDGFDVLAKLKESDNCIPVIVLSNLSQEEDIFKAKSLGAVEFWVKSNMQLAQIIEYIKKLLKK